jgi:hypothetical protein
MNATSVATSPVPPRAASKEANDVPLVGGADFGVLVALLQQLIATRPAGVAILDVPASGPSPAAADAPLLAAVGRGVVPTSRGPLGGEALALETAGDDAGATIADLVAPTGVPVVAPASPMLVVARSAPLETNVLDGPWPSNVEAFDAAGALSPATTLPRSSNGADRAPGDTLLAPSAGPSPNVVVLPRGDAPATTSAAAETFAASFEPRVDAAAPAPARTGNGTAAAPTPPPPPAVAHVPPGGSALPSPATDATARPKDGASVDAPRGGAPAAAPTAPRDVQDGAMTVDGHGPSSTSKPGEPSPPAPASPRRDVDGGPARTRGAMPIAAVSSDAPAARSEGVLPRPVGAEELTDAVSAGRPRLVRDTGADVQASGEGLGVAGEAPVMSRATPSRAVENGPVEITRHPIEQVAARLGEIRHGDRREIFLRLDPPDLGVVRIEARLEGTRLSVQIHTEQASTRELLAAALPRLRESLSQQGFEPSLISVHLGLDGSGYQPGHDRTPLVPEPVAGGPPARPRPASASDPVPAASAGLDLWA